MYNLPPLGGLGQENVALEQELQHVADDILEKCAPICDMNGGNCFVPADCPVSGGGLPGWGKPCTTEEGCAGHESAWGCAADSRSCGACLTLDGQRGFLHGRTCTPVFEPPIHAPRPYGIPLLVAVGLGLAWLANRGGR